VTDQLEVFGVFQDYGVFDFYGNCFSKLDRFDAQGELNGFRSKDAERW
jgi:hypothetical protein